MRDFLQFLSEASTAFHAVFFAEERLLRAGFVRLEETEGWVMESAGRYYVKRHDSSIIAFVLGEKSGYRIAAAHTDSPGLKIKADSERRKAGAIRVSVEVYGAPILATWLDRPLGIAGRVIAVDGGRLTPHLFRTSAPMAVIPNLSLHLNRDVNKGFELSAQDHLKAIISSLNERESDGFIRGLLAEQLDVSPDSIRDYDLYLFEHEPPYVLGADEDLICAGRIDNLGMCHAALSAFLGSDSTAYTRVLALFDSEEIGSHTLQGAQSSFLRDILHRIVLSKGENQESFYRNIANSYLVSGDAAHAVHPNFPEKHDDGFAPEINRGPVLKINAGQRYTTTAETGAVFSWLCEQNGIPMQKLIGRSDMPSGSTIGPAVSSSLGVKSVDVGNPIWAMHSIRETAGVNDHRNMVAALQAFYSYA